MPCPCFQDLLRADVKCFVFLLERMCWISHIRMVEFNFMRIWRFFCHQKVRNWRYNSRCVGHLKAYVLTDNLFIVDPFELHGIFFFARPLRALQMGIFKELIMYPASATRTFRCCIYFNPPGGGYPYPHSLSWPRLPGGSRILLKGAPTSISMAGRYSGPSLTRGWTSKSPEHGKNG